MKILIFVFGLILPALCENVENMTDLNTIPVCATLNNVNKTFDNIWQLYNEFKTTGQLWIPVATGVCPLKQMDCTVFEPVCAVSRDNFFKTFPNSCILEAEQKATGTVWSIVFNGICSTNPGDGFETSPILPTKNSVNKEEAENDEKASSVPPLSSVPLQSSYSSVVGPALSISTSGNLDQPLAQPKQNSLPLYSPTPTPGSIYYKPAQESQTSCNNDQNTGSTLAKSSIPSNAAAIASRYYTPNRSSYSVQEPQLSSGYNKGSEPPLPLLDALQPNGNHYLDLAPKQPASDPSQATLLSSYTSPPLTASSQYNPKENTQPSQDLQPPVDYNKNSAPNPYVAAPLQRQSSTAYNAIPSSPAALQPSSSPSYVLVPTAIRYYKPTQILQPIKEPQLSSIYSQGVTNSPTLAPGAVSAHTDISYSSAQNVQSAEEPQSQPSSSPTKHMKPNDYRHYSQVIQPQPTQGSQPTGYNNQKAAAKSAALGSSQTSSTSSTSSRDSVHTSQPSNQCSEPNAESLSHEPAQELRPSGNYIKDSEPKSSYLQPAPSAPYHAAPSLPSSYYSYIENPQPSSESQSLEIISAPSFSLEQYKPGAESPPSPSNPSSSANCSQPSANDAAESGASPSANVKVQEYQNSDSPFASPIADNYNQPSVFVQPEAAYLPAYSPPSVPSVSSPNREYYKHYYYTPNTNSQPEPEHIPFEKPSPLYSQHQLEQSYQQTEVSDVAPSQQSHETMADDKHSLSEGCQQQRSHPNSYSPPEPSNGYSNNDEQSSPDVVASYTQIPNDISVTSDMSSNDDQQTNLENSNHSGSANKDDNEPNANNEGQVIYNGVVYQGPYYYEPKYKHINFGNFNILPAQKQASSLLAPEAPVQPPESVSGAQNHEYSSNHFEDLLKHLLYIASIKYKSA